MSISGGMGYLKAKISLMIFQRFLNAEFAYRNQKFWCRRYYWNTADKNTKSVKELCNKSVKTRWGR